MELRNNSTPGRRIGARAAQAGPERIKADANSASSAREADLRATVDRVGDTARQNAAQLKRTAGNAGDRVEFSKLAEQIADQDAHQARRREQVADLRSAHLEGRLNDHASAERAAERMLGSQ